jgi:molybdopterin-guanine dinucleotide biosynthesis protein A
VFCLCRRTLADHLHAFLAEGGRKIDRWYGSLKIVEVAFDDEEAAFRNINTRDELSAAAKGTLPGGRG